MLFQKQIIMSVPIVDLIRRIKDRLPIEGIKAILFHPNPHLDEIGSVKLLQKYGEKFFPGISNTAIGWMTQKMLTEYCKGPEGIFFQMLAQGYLVIGTGDGPFDDHNKKGTSCIKLVARYLGIDKNPELQFLLNYVDYEDQNGDKPELLGGPDGYLKKAAQNFLLASQIKTAWRVIDARQSSKEEKGEWRSQNILWFLETIEMNIEDQTMLRKAMSEIQGAIQYKDLSLSSVPEARLAIIHSDNPHAVKAARLSFGKNKVIAILLIQTNGQFQIFSQQKFGLKIEDAVRVIRINEFEIQGKQIPDWAQLGQERLEGSRIHYHKDMENIYNGSTTQRDTPPLLGKNGLFQKEDLLGMIMTGLQDRKFQSEFKEGCQKGDCVRRKCSLYPIGLQRCFNVRNGIGSPEG